MSRYLLLHRYEPTLDGAHLQAARLRALRDLEARRRAVLALAIRRAERSIRVAEALDEQFDRRFVAVLQLVSVRLTTRSRVRSQARATAAGATLSTSLEWSERSRHVARYAN
jgi:hypothetical protein